MPCFAHSTLLSVMLMGMRTTAPQTAMGKSIFKLGGEMGAVRDECRAATPDIKKGIVLSGRPCDPSALGMTSEAVRLLRHFLDQNC